MRVSGEKIDMTQKNERTLVIIPGDGIGPEIIGQASRVVEWFDRDRGLGLDESSYWLCALALGPRELEAELRLGAAARNPS